jgi:hypothetical protein
VWRFSCCRSFTAYLYVTPIHRPSCYFENEGRFFF